MVDVKDPKSKILIFSYIYIKIFFCLVPQDRIAWGVILDPCRICSRSRKLHT